MGDRRRRFFAVAIFALFALSTLCAQTFRGGIVGTVTDSTGAAIPGASITVASAATGLTRTAQTDAEGSYAVNELPLGSYSVTASRNGFRTVTASGVTVAVGAPQRVDLQLPAGAVSEKVEVTAAVPLIESTNDNAGGIIEGSQASNLPVNGRDFTKLLVQVAGATGDPSGAADSPGSFGLFSINGNRGRANNYLLDGTDMNDGYRNLPDINEAGVFGTPATILPVDAIAEMPIINGGEAEYGRNSGAIVDIVTKSGTNQWHGSAYEFFRNQNLDARNFFNASPNLQDRFDNNQFGGTFGGPIIRDKTFFFLAYEGQREHGGLPLQTTVPTQADVLSNSAAGINPIISNLLALNPWHVPASLLTTSPSGFPLPAGPAGGLTIPVTDDFNNRVDSLIVKIDHHLRGNHDLFTSRYFYGNSDQSFPLGLEGGSAVNGYNTVTPTSVHVVSLSYVFVPSDRLTVEFRAGYNRLYENFLPQDVSFNPASIGLNNGVSDPHDLGLPHINLTGYSSIGATSGINRGRTDQNYQFFNNYSYILGQHNFKWGYEYHRTNVSQFFDAGYRGQLNFGAGVNPLTGVNESAFFNFLTGETVAGGNHQLQGFSQRDTFQNNSALFFQDSWRLLPRLTLNLGLRWDYYGVIGEAQNRFSIFNPVTQAAQPVSQLYPRDLNNFAPRVSAAWDVTGSGKTVVRAGWGVYYDVFSQDFFIGELPFPTSNSGPAYNFVGASSPFSILESFSPNPGLGVEAPGICNPGDVTIPNSGGQCAASTFAFSPSFGNDTFTVDQNIRTPYVQNYNLNVQRQFGSHLALQLGYVGSTGRKLFHYVDINQCNPGLLSAGLPCHPFPSAPGFGYVLEFQSSASSQYNSLQTQLNLRDFHGIDSTFNYVYAHSIDSASDGQDFVPNASQPDNSFNPGGERASSNFDQRHRFTWRLSYQFPNPQAWKKLTNGWGIETISTFATGQPYNLSVIDNFSFDFNGTGELYGRPDVVGNPFTGAGGRDPVSGAPQVLNLAAFQVPCNFDPINGCSPANPGKHIGNLGRNAFNGTNFNNVDFSLVKNTKIGERLTVQLRADFFNLLNHPNFSNPLLPNFLVDMAQNGLDATGHGVGFLAPTATPDVGIGNPFLGGGGPRNIQLALRLSF